MSSPVPDVPLVPGGLFHVSPDTVIVEDADEEIMELYMNLEATTSTGAADSGGLGFINANQAEIEMTLEIVPASSATDTTVSDAIRTKVKGRRKDRTKDKPQSIEVELRVIQDPSALRARTGDTGSVLWRSSLHLARHLLSQHFFPPPEPLLSLEKLRVLELGAGTGVLAALLGPLCMSYIATDQPANTRLVEKNISVNSGAIKRSALGSPATIVSLDWMDVTTARKRATTKGHVYAVPEARDVDLVLAVDCIYNEALVQPLVDTLAATCSRGAIAWVVVELRSSDVLTLFLDTWLKDAAGWTVVRLGPEAMGSWAGSHSRWVGWVGWCSAGAE